MKAVFLPIMLALAFTLLAVSTAHPSKDMDTDGDDNVNRISAIHHLQALVSGPLGAKLSNGVYRLQVEGPKGGIFTIISDNGVRQVVEGDDQHEGKPDVTVTVQTKEFMKIIEGSLSPMQAYNSGMLQVQGNIHMLGLGV